jgi:hypothetical protein
MWSGFGCRKNERWKRFGKERKHSTKKDGKLAEAVKNGK